MNIPRANRNYSFDFKGYHPKVFSVLLPETSGIYLIYRGHWNRSSNRNEPIELLYIGQATNLRKRLKEHEYYQIMESNLAAGEKLLIAYCEVEHHSLNKVENAYIYHAQPPINTQGKNSYNHNRATIVTTGSAYGIQDTFTVDSQ